MGKIIIACLASAWRRFRLHLIAVLISWVALVVLRLVWPPRERLGMAQASSLLLVAIILQLALWVTDSKRYKATVEWLSRHAPWWPEVWFVALYGAFLFLLATGNEFPLGGEFAPSRSRWATGIGLGLGSFVFRFYRTLSPWARGEGYAATVFLVTGMALSSGDLASAFITIGALGWMGFGMLLGFDVGKQARPGATVIQAVAEVVRRGRGQYRFGVPDEVWFAKCYEASRLLAEGHKWEDVAEQVQIPAKTLRRWLAVYDAIRQELDQGVHPTEVARRYNRSLPVLLRYARRLSGR